MSARRSSQGPHNIQEGERESSFPGVSFLLSSEAPVRNLYEKERLHQHNQESNELHSKCKRTISLLKMHQREPHFDGRLHQKEISPSVDGQTDPQQQVARNIEVLRFEYKIKELEVVISELSTVNEQLQKNLQKSNSQIQNLTKSLEASEIKLLELTNKCSLLQTQLQRAQDDILIREQQAVSKGQFTAAESIERVKKTYEHQLEVRRVQSIQSTKLFKTTVEDVQKELEKVQKKFEASEKQNKQLEGVLQQKNKIIATLNVKKNGEYQSILEEQSAQIVSLQTALKEYKKTFKQEGKIVKDLSSRETVLHEKVVQLQEENQRLHIEIKKIMRLASSEVKNLVEERKQRDISAQEKEKQYERFLQVQQKQVERFQRELRLALKSKKIENTQKSPVSKKHISGSSSTRQNTATTNRAKRSQSSSHVPTKKSINSIQNDVGEYEPTMNMQTLPEREFKVRKPPIHQVVYPSDFNAQKKVDVLTYPMNGESVYLLQDTQADPEVTHDRNNSHQVFNNNQRYSNNQFQQLQQQMHPQHQNQDDLNREYQEEYQEGEEQYGENTIHERIAELQKQLIFKQNENLSLQAQLFQESQNVFVDEYDNDSMVNAN